MTMGVWGDRALVVAEDDCRDVIRLPTLNENRPLPPEAAGAAAVAGPSTGVPAPLDEFLPAELRRGSAAVRLGDVAPSSVSPPMLDVDRLVASGGSSAPGPVPAASPVPVPDRPRDVVTAPLATPAGLPPLAAPAAAAAGALPARLVAPPMVA